MSSLFERLGGDAAVNAAVDIFYEKVLADNSLASFFTSVDMDKQHNKQRKFLTMAFGGPNKYSGKGLRAIHKPLLENGLGDSHFDAVAGHLQDTLIEMGVALELIDEVMIVAGGTRDDVLNR